LTSASDHHRPELVEGRLAFSKPWFDKLTTGLRAWFCLLVDPINPR
jgi:hypothetical protein